MTISKKQKINYKNKQHSVGVAIYNPKDRTKTLIIPPKGKRTRPIVITGKYNTPNETEVIEIDETLSRYFIKFLPNIYQDSKLEFNGITFDSKKNKINRKFPKNKNK